MGRLKGAGLQGVVCGCLLLAVASAAEAATVQFAKPGRTAGETSGSVGVAVTLSEASATDVIVPFMPGGTAGNNSDYSIASASVTIPANSTSASIPVSISDDSGAESTESVIITLGAPTGATLGSPSVFTLSIVDNDGGGGLGTGSATVIDAAGGTVTFSTSTGLITALERTSKPADVPAGVSFRNGFFAYVIEGVPVSSSLALSVLLPAGSAPSGWIDCPGASCYRYGTDDLEIAGDLITVTIVDNGLGDSDTVAGRIASTVAPVRADTGGGGALNPGLLLPFGAAALRRRRRP
jgi:hypothetical protein